MTNTTVPEDKRALFRKLVDTHPDLELQGGQKLPYTSLNGNMFTQMNKEGRLGLRLGQAERQAFIEKFNTQLFTNYGTVMQEYVEVPDALLADTEALAPYLAQSYAYAQTLKPK